MWRLKAGHLGCQNSPDELGGEREMQDGQGDREPGLGSQRRSQVPPSWGRKSLLITKLGQEKVETGLLTNTRPRQMHES